MLQKQNRTIKQIVTAVLIIIVMQATIINEANAKETSRTYQYNIASDNFYRRGGEAFDDGNSPSVPPNPYTGDTHSNLYSLVADSGGGLTRTIYPRIEKEDDQLIFIFIGLTYDNTKYHLLGPWRDIVLWSKWATELYGDLTGEKTGEPYVSKLNTTFYFLSDKPLESRGIIPDMPLVSTSGSYQFNWQEYSATKSNVLQVIKESIERTRYDTCIYFIFSGHGGITKDNHQYIVLKDNETLTDIELKGAFDSYGLTGDSDYTQNHDHLYFFFDCCYGGGMREVSEIYNQNSVAFFAACQDKETTESVNTQDFLGHTFANIGLRDGPEGMLTLAFIDQYRDRTNNNWKGYKTFINTYFEFCWSNSGNSPDLYDLISNFPLRDGTSITPVFIDGDPTAGHYFYPWWI